MKTPIKPALMTTLWWEPGDSWPPPPGRAIRCPRCHEEHIPKHLEHESSEICEWCHTGEAEEWCELCRKWMPKLSEETLECHWQKHIWEPTLVECHRLDALAKAAHTQDEALALIKESADLELTALRARPMEEMV